MVNYKPWRGKAILGGGIYFTLPEGATYRMLIIDKAPTVVGVTLQDPETADNYAVPTGKKFILCNVHIRNGAVNKILTLYQSDTIDTSTNPVTLWHLYTRNISNTEQFTPGTFAEVEAGKYINNKTNNVTSTSLVDYCLGYEIDA